MGPYVLEGTWEEIKLHEAELMGRRLRVIVTPESLPASRAKKPATAAPKRRVSAMGKYAFVPGGSEEFEKEKQAEIEREDRARE